MIDNNARRNALYIKEIRNAFSHTIRNLRFSVPEVANVCALLTFCEQRSQIPDDPKNQFYLAIIDTGMAILGARVLSPRNQPTPP